MAADQLTFRADGRTRDEIERFIEDHNYDTVSGAVRDLVASGLEVERQKSRPLDTWLGYVAMSFALFSFGLVLAALSVYPQLDRVAMATSTMTILVLTTYVVRLMSLPGVDLPSLRGG